jgi:hypothetical protein
LLSDGHLHSLLGSSPTIILICNMVIQRSITSSVSSSLVLWASQSFDFSQSSHVSVDIMDCMKCPKIARLHHHYWSCRREAVSRVDFIIWCPVIIPISLCVITGELKLDTCYKNCKKFQPCLLRRFWVKI